MTQVELANKLGIPYQSIGQWERGVRNPKVETIGKIARALDVNLLSILEGSVTVEEISAEIDMPEELVYAALYTPDKVSSEVLEIVNRVAPVLAIELKHPQNIENEGEEIKQSLTVEEIKNAFRGKSIEELSEILAAVSKEISEQAAQVSNSND